MEVFFEVIVKYPCASDQLICVIWINFIDNLLDFFIGVLYSVAIKFSTFEVIPKLFELIKLEGVLVCSSVDMEHWLDHMLIHDFNLLLAKLLNSVTFTFVGIGCMFKI